MEQHHNEKISFYRHTAGFLNLKEGFELARNTIEKKIAKEYLNNLIK